MSRSPKATKAERTKARDQGRILPQDRPGAPVNTIEDVLSGKIPGEQQFYVGTDPRGTNLYKQASSEAVVDSHPIAVFEGWEFYPTVMENLAGVLDTMLAVRHQKPDRKGDVMVLPVSRLFCIAENKVESALNGEDLNQHRLWLNEFIEKSLWRNGFEWQWPASKDKYMSLFRALQKIPDVIIGMSRNRIGNLRVVAHNPVDSALEVVAEKSSE